MEPNEAGQAPSDESTPAFEPYVASRVHMAEFTLKAVLLGMVFGIVFGAANAYLGLRAGLTISTSIPIAVMTVAAFRVLRAFSAGGTILEANLAQTVGSASSSVASGVIFTLPALFLWGLDPDLLQMTMLATLGGMLGILFMIPLRPFLMEREHGRLPYPEGTACAEVLRAAETGGSRASIVFGGLFTGGLFKFLTGFLKVVPKDASLAVPFLPKGRIGMDVSSALFGVGYILGPRVGAIMVGGGLLSSLVLIPAIAWWGMGRGEPLYPETVQTIQEMSPSRIWTRYVRYIGAGAVATGGLITLVKSIPTMIQSFRVGARELKGRMGGGGPVEAVERTRQDLPLGLVAVALVVIFLVLGLVPRAFGAIEDTQVRLVAAFLVVLCAFFFVAVSSRIVGLVGVTSNPTSGMTIASLLLTTSVFLAFGWTGDLGKAAALSVGCVIAIAASIAGDTSQDLKTGYLLGATPRRQQIGELAGVLSCAFFVCATVRLLHETYGFGSEELPAPQATLMKVVIEGVLEQSLPWTLVGIGAGIAIVVELLRVPSLPFAVGVYLPVATMVPVFLGGLLRHFLERRAANADEATARKDRGVLFGSGLVGGAGLTGVAIAAWAYVQGAAPSGIGHGWAGGFEGLLGVAAMGLLAVVLTRRACAEDAEV